MPFTAGDEQFLKMENMDNLTMMNPSLAASDTMFPPTDLLYDFGMFGTDQTVANDNFDDFFNFDQQ